MSKSVDTYRVLEGLALGDGWELGAIKASPADAGGTGGNFSVQFDAVHPDGRSAFCKVLDLVTSAEPPNVVKKLELATKAFNYEADLIQICGRYGARRVVYALTSGEISDSRVPLSLIQFILFERADEDARSYLDKGLGDDLHLRFRGLRHIALGIRELHSLQIAHQDLKPSNVLVFDCDSEAHQMKIADLGRASLAGQDATHDPMRVAGAIAYSPPELLYGQVSIEFYTRRQSCDLYQMGCLIAYMLAGTSVNFEWSSRLTDSQRWQNWGESYADIYPLIRQLMNDTFSLIEPRLDPAIRDDTMVLIRDLCDPDPRLRGSRLQGSSSSRSIIITRLITRLNVLEQRSLVARLRAA